MIEDLLEHIGVEDIHPHESEVTARCPRHEERTGQREHHPRHWSVNRSTGRHHCFSCAYGGSLIKLIVDVGNVGMWDAYLLLHRYDVVLEEPTATVWVPPVSAVELRGQLLAFGDPPVRAMERRRLTPELVNRFGVRWNYEDPSWIFPIFGPDGDLWGWQSKNPEGVRNKPPGIKKSLTLFGLNVLRSDVSVALVESPLDALYLDALGYPAVSSFGAGVSDAQMRLVIERFDEVVLALDNDEAGRNETRRLLRAKWHHRLPTLVFNYKSIAGKDPGECRPEEIKQAMDDATLATFW